MTNIEFLGVVIAVATIIAMGVYYIIDCTRTANNNFANFKRDLKIGDKYISYIQFVNNDPFKDECKEISVKILGVRFNHNDEMWVKILWSDGHEGSMSVDDLYHNFYKA